MGGDAKRAGIPCPDSRASQRHPHACLARQARQKPRGAYIRREADGDLRHGELRALASNAVRAEHGNAHAPAKIEPVNERNIRLGIARDGLVELIFFTPEFALFGVFSRQTPLVDVANVAACAKGAAASPANDNPRDAGVTLPLVKRLRQRAHHDRRQRIQRVRTIKCGDAGSAAPFQ